MIKKYELTDQTINVFGHTLFRIKAKISFSDVTAGDIGGYIEKEENLETSGDAWVYDNALVYGNALVSGDAQVHGDAWVYGDAQVYDHARVFDNACVYNNARLYGDAWVFDNARVYGDARVFDDACVCDNARLYGNALVSGDARLYGNAFVSGDAQVSGNADYMTISPIGSRNDCITFMRTKTLEIYVSVGCFFGSIAAFREKVQKTHGDNKHAKAYLLAADLAEIRMNTRMEELEFMF